MSKAKSGLASIRRDFSDAPTSSQDDPIPWDPTPPKPPPSSFASSSASAATTSSDAQNARETARERRLREIQNALNARSSPAVAIPTRPVPAKRPSDPTLSDTAHPAKKARQLPPGYGDDDYVPASRGSSSSRPKAIFTAPPKKANNGAVKLSEEQQQILKLVEDGKSVFYTGSAGEWRIHRPMLVLILVPRDREIRPASRNHQNAQEEVCPQSRLCRHYSLDWCVSPCLLVAAHSVQVLLRATLAASPSIRSPASGLESRKWRSSATRSGRTRKPRRGGKGPGCSLSMKVRVLLTTLSAFQNHSVVSMLDGDLFDKLSRIAGMLKRSTAAFGGIQLVVTGDFFQLPPVSKSNVKFAFEAVLWKEVIPHTFNLTQVFRQSDQEFIDMLNEMRFGALTARSIAKFKSLSREIHYEDGLGPTELYPRREDVQSSNFTRMKGLNSKVHVFTSADGGTVTDQQQRDRLLSNFMAEGRLELREGAQVMLIKNMDESFVNGSMGIVKRFADPAKALEEEFEVLGEQAVAAPGGGKKAPLSTAATASKGVLYPIVEFSMANGAKAMMMVKPESFKIELPTGGGAGEPVAVAVDPCVGVEHT
ncbi:ATP-dependent DNA helicase PIF1 [Mycena kentingensis (nom. inval.)]|nr:ATP-dependent DNA helicase PIF1 [Mycena kentingensis (nom. inval.)]